MKQVVKPQLNKEIKELTGQIAYPTIGLSMFAGLSYLATLLGFATGYISPALTVLMLAFLTFTAYTPMHEAVHGNIGGNRQLNWLDKVIGYLMAPIIAIPFTSHQKEHFAHHRDTNGKDDPDVHIKNLFGSPKDFVKATITVIKTQNAYVWNTFTKAEIGVSLGWRILFIYFTGWISIPVLLLGWFGGAFLTIFLLSYIPHQPYKNTARWQNTNIRLLPIQWLENLMYKHNLHAVHHLYPRVPFYNYRKAFEKLEPSMRENGTPFV